MCTSRHKNRSSKGLGRDRSQKSERLGKIGRRKKEYEDVGTAGFHASCAAKSRIYFVGGGGGGRMEKESDKRS